MNYIRDCLATWLSHYWQALLNSSGHTVASLLLAIGLGGGMHVGHLQPLVEWPSKYEAAATPQLLMKQIAWFGYICMLKNQNMDMRCWDIQILESWGMDWASLFHVFEIQEKAFFGFWPCAGCSSSALHLLGYSSWGKAPTIVAGFL